MGKQKNITYNEAIRELEAILSELENNQEIDMDFIASKVKRAATLMDFCKKQLHEIDNELTKILEDIN